MFQYFRVAVPVGLGANPISTEYTLSILTPDRDRIPDLQARLEALPEVDSLETPLNYVPADQQEKQRVLEDIQFLLWSALSPSHSEASTSDEALNASIAAMHDSIARSQVHDPDVRSLLHHLYRLAAELCDIVLAVSDGVSVAGVAGGVWV